MFGGAFGAFGTENCHFFDESHPAFRRIAAITRLRRRTDQVGYALRRGDLYVREVRYADKFVAPAQGQVAAWSRVAEQASVVVAINTHGNESRSADITVDSTPHPGGSRMTVLYRGDWDDAKLDNPPGQESIEATCLEDGRCIIHLDLPPAGMAILS